MGILDAPAANRSDTAAALNMALRGFPQKTAPLSKLWFSPGASGHGGTTAGSGFSAANVNDTTTFALGTQCMSAQMAGGASSAQGYFTKTGLTIDATGQNVRVWVKFDNWATVGSISIVLGDDTFSNYFTSQIYTAAGQTEAKSNIRSGEWVALDVPWGDFTVGAGSPTRSAITCVRATFIDAANGGAGKVYFGGIGGVTPNTTRFPNGICVITADDCSVAQFTILRPYLDKYGYAATLYPIIEAFGYSAGTLTLAQAKQMAAVNGWDFGLHAMTYASHTAGFDTFTAAQMHTEMRSIRAWMTANGLRGDSFAWPLVRSSKTVEDVVGCYCRTARGGVSRTTEVLPPSMPYRMRAFGVDSAATASTVQAYLARVKASGALGILTFHDIVASGATSTSCLTSVMQAAIDYINAQGIAVLTMSQVNDLAL